MPDETPPPALSVEEARREMLMDGTSHAGFHLEDDMLRCYTCKESLRAFESAIRAESAEALRAATARAERAEAMLMERRYQVDAAGAIHEIVCENCAALSATEEGAGPSASRTS